MKKRLLQLSIFLFLATTSHAYYQAEQGRWLNRDPIEEQGGVNVYGFVYNDPCSWFDDLGMKPRNTGKVPLGNQPAPSYPTSNKIVTPKAPNVSSNSGVASGAGWIAGIISKWGRSSESTESSKGEMRCREKSSPSWVSHPAMISCKCCVIVIKERFDYAGQISGQGNSYSLLHAVIEDKPCDEVKIPAESIGPVGVTYIYNLVDW